MSTTIQAAQAIAAPEPDAPANYFTGSAYPYALDAVILSAVANRGAPVEGCRVTLQLSADGGRNYSDARTVAAGIADGVTSRQAFALADFAALGAWTHWRLRWGGNIGAAVSVSAAVDCASIGPVYLASGALETALYDNGNSGSSATIDPANGNNQVVTITGAATLSFVAPANPCKCTLLVVQDGTGHSYSVSGVKWPGGAAPTLSSTPGAIDCITVFWSSGTGFVGQAATNFS